jgi:hypothetical protein
MSEGVGGFKGAGEWGRKGEWRGCRESILDGEFVGDGLGKDVGRLR